MNVSALTIGTLKETLKAGHLRCIFSIEKQNSQHMALSILIPQRPETLFMKQNNMMKQ